MTSRVDEGYFGWLYSLAGGSSNRNPRKSHFSLLSQLHTKSYRWYLRNDENRAEDGQDLRNRFLEDAREVTLFEPDEDSQWLEYEASVLEVIIAISEKTAFESYGTGADWFWKIMENLGLSKYTDDVYLEGVDEEVNKVLEQFLSRSYGVDGTGGLFPLRMPEQDQRHVEMWYQMCAYLLEGDVVNNGP